ncbi:hypothetical protein, partial [Acetobacter estunensis]|uniref:hypothetical protein n=1 Tax=Acetobacter estunensis TaxID=104097 RepID=UPI001A7F01A2
NIKETRLLHIAIPSINAEEIESYRRPQNQGVFRTLQVTAVAPGMGQVMFGGPVPDKSGESGQGEGSTP